MADERSPNEASSQSESSSQEGAGANWVDEDLDAMDAGGALPQIDFPTFLVSLYHSALLHMGEVAPDGRKGKKNKPLAKQSIDILAMLQAKSKGNLTSDEERLLQTMLYDLRMKYVNLSS